VQFALGTAPALPAGSQGRISHGLGRRANLAKAVWQQSSPNWPIFWGMPLLVIDQVESGVVGGIPGQD